MWGEGRTLVVTMVGGALVSVVLGWTLVVYTAGAVRRRRLDPLLTGLLVLSGLRQAGLVGRAAVGLFRPAHQLVHYCGLLVWSASSVAVLQGAVLATLGLCLAARSAPRYARLVTRSHLAYHLVSAALLSSCVGVAAVLARRSPADCLDSARGDPRYSLFALALHTALALVSLAGLLASFCLPGPPPPHSSASDLSSSSLSSRRTLSDASGRARQYLVSQLLGAPAKVDLEHMSTTSSTNSRAYLARPRPLHDVPRVAVVSVLLVSLASNHIPILAVTAGLELWGWRYPVLSHVPDWSTLAEGILLPLVLALSDRAFIERLSKVYTRPKPPDFSRPPQGAYGKFMQRGSMVERGQHTPPVRFPITNGSLFASLDGRIPPIHRRFKGGGRWYWGRIEGLVDEPDPLYASLSGKSACSATTQANSDFEFYSSRPAHQQVDNKENMKGGVIYKRSLNDHERVPRMRSSGDLTKDAPVARQRPVPGLLKEERACRLEALRSAGGAHNLVPVMSMDSLVAALHKQDFRQRNKWESVPDLARPYLADCL